MESSVNHVKIFNYLFATVQSWRDYGCGDWEPELFEKADKALLEYSGTMISYPTMKELNTARERAEHIVKLLNESLNFQLS